MCQNGYWPGPPQVPLGSGSMANHRMSSSSLVEHCCRWPWTLARPPYLYQTIGDGRQRACTHAAGLAIVSPGEAARVRCIVVCPPHRLRSAGPALGTLGLVAAARHSSPWETESRHRRVAPGFLSLNLNPRNPKLNRDATVFLSIPMARPCCNNFRGCFSRRGIRGFWC